MTALQTFIEEQERELDDSTTYNPEEDNSPWGIPEIKSWHKQSLISFLRMEIGRLEEKNKFYSEMMEKASLKNRLAAYADFHSKRQVLQDQITHYKEYIKILES